MFVVKREECTFGPSLVDSFVYMAGIFGFCRNVYVSNKWAVPNYLGSWLNERFRSVCMVSLYTAL